MTDKQKEQISQMRSAGIGYLKIAKELGISGNTVKSYCRRNKLPAGNTLDASEIVSDTGDTEHICLTCGKPVKQNDKRKEKKFCSDNCRMAWWNTHRDKVRHRNIEERECPCCSSMFSVCGKSERKYCSHSCYIKYRFGGGNDEQGSV